MRVIAFIRAKILRRFIDLKVMLQKQVSHDEIIRCELLVAMCLISLSFGTFYIIAGLVMNISLLGVLNYLIFFMTTIPIVLYLLKKGMYNPAKLIMMILGTAFMFIKASSLGPASGMNLSMMTILFATFAFYSIADYKYILLSVFITLTSIGVLEYTDYSLLGIDVSTNAYEYEFNFIATILLCVLFFYVILRVNQYNNKKLLRLNNKLLSKNNRLKKINQELDSYVYKVSHDMRAPITSMMGIVNLIKEQHDISNIKQLAELQEACLGKLDDHIHQIIHLSRNNKTGIQYEPIDFAEIIREIFDELSFFENAVKTEKIISIKENATFYSDEYRLKMILTNLISNAFKYARTSISNAFIEVDLTVSEKETIILVRDNGIGISAESQSRIFDMFYRGTDVSKGSGLGLYIVKEMVVKLNGEVSVESELASYTTFRLVFPNVSLK